MPSAATTPVSDSAISSARRHDSIPVPIVTTRTTPTDAGAFENVAQRVADGVEMRMRVDHPPAARASSRASSSATTVTRIELREEWLGCP